MTQGKCIVCKIIAFLAGLGALNWGLYAIADLDLVARIFGDMTLMAKILYCLIGLAGLAVLICMMKPCPCCKKK